MFNILKYIFNPDPFKDQVHTPSGIPIKFESNEHHFPPGWKLKNSNSQLVKIHKNEVSKSSFLIRKALDKYPVDLLQKHLKTVHVFGGMTFDGNKYAGTHSLDQIYLSNRGYSMGYTASLIETTVHHEFASILLFRYLKFINKKKWTHISASTYSGDGSDSFSTNKTNHVWRKELHELGFLHDFSSSGFRNDFVSMAENLFLGEPRFKAVIEKYPLLYEKYKMAISFYYLIDDRLTPKYFREIHL